MSIGNWSSWSPSATVAAAAAIAAATSGVEQAELAVRLRGGQLDQGQRADEPAREALAGDREVEDGALGRRAVEGVGRDGHLAHRVALDAGALRGRRSCVDRTVRRRRGDSAGVTGT